MTCSFPPLPTNVFAYNTVLVTLRPFKRLPWRVPSASVSREIGCGTELAGEFLTFCIGS